MNHPPASLAPVLDIDGKTFPVLKKMMTGRKPIKNFVIEFPRFVDGGVVPAKSILTLITQFMANKDERLIRLTRPSDKLLVLEVWIKERLETKLTEITAEGVYVSQQELIPASLLFREELFFSRLEASDFPSQVVLGNEAFGEAYKALYLSNTDVEAVYIEPIIQRITATEKGNYISGKDLYAALKDVPRNCLLEIYLGQCPGLLIPFRSLYSYIREVRQDPELYLEFTIYSPPGKDLAPLAPDVGGKLPPQFPAIKISTWGKWPVPRHEVHFKGVMANGLHDTNRSGQRVYTVSFVPSPIK